MKGLLVKDLRIVLQNKKLFFLMGLIAVFYMFSMGEEAASFVISFITMICGMLVMTTISTDEFDKSTIFLMTMPIKKSTYALEKYVFAFGCNLSGWGISTLLCILIQKEGKLELLQTALILLAVFCLFQMILLPIQLKYGGEKGRIVLIIVAGVIFASALLLEKGKTLIFSSEAEADAWIVGIMTKIQEISLWKIAAGAALLWIVVLVISYSISKRIMEKKEF